MNDEKKERDEQRVKEALTTTENPPNLGLAGFLEGVFGGTLLGPAARAVGEYVETSADIRCERDKLRERIETYCREYCFNCAETSECAGDCPLLVRLGFEDKPPESVTEAGGEE